MAKRRTAKRRPGATARKQGYTTVWMKGGRAIGKSRRYLKKSDADRVAKTKRKQGYTAKVVDEFRTVKVSAAEQRRALAAYIKANYGV